MNRASLSILLCVATCVSLPAGEVSQDIDASYNASAGASTNLGNSRNGKVSEQNTDLQYVFSYSIPDKPVIRAGFGYDRFDFGVPAGGRLPDSLQSLNLVLGADLQVSDVLIRIEAQPGFYGTLRESGSRDFNVPVVLGLSWLVSKDLQWIAGLSFDANRDLPVLGGIGVRWKLSDRWLLNAIPPHPRLEFKAGTDLTLFAGGHITSSTFRVDRRFGSSVGDARFNNALVEYTEVRAGAGLSWRVNSSATVDAELGYMAYRDFNFHKLDENLETKSGAIYGQVGLGIRF